MHRRRAWILCLAVAALAYLGAVASGIMPGLERYFGRDVARDITGCTAVLGDAEDTFDSPRSSSGSNYTVARFALPPELALCFDQPATASSPLAGPRDDEGDWDGLSWRRAPLSGRDSAIVQWAFADNNQQLAADLRSALNLTTSLYAIRFTDDGVFPKSRRYVDLFVVDPLAGRVYLLNLDT